MAQAEKAVAERLSAAHAAARAGHGPEVTVSDAEMANVAAGNRGSAGVKREREDEGPSGASRGAAAAPVVCDYPEEFPLAKDDDDEGDFPRGQVERRSGGAGGGAKRQNTGATGGGRGGAAARGQQGAQGAASGGRGRGGAR